jgi:hypothetical protein
MVLPLVFSRKRDVVAGPDEWNTNGQIVTENLFRIQHWNAIVHKYQYWLYIAGDKTAILHNGVSLAFPLTL